MFSALCLMSAYPALAVQFGKNKVQYRTFDWKYISTSNFDIYYDKGSKYLADFTAVEAEKALQKISNLLKFRVNSRIPILVYNSQNDFQQTNVISQYMSEGIQGVTELFKNRVVLPFFGEYGNFRHVVHHELVHAVLNQYLYGGTFQTAVQTGQNIEFPLYMNEGLAEYASQGGQDAQNDMFIRDLAISERIRGLNYMNNYLAYRGGQTFYWYIAEKYGEEKIAELIQKIRLGFSLDQAFTTVFKMKYEEFSDMWAKDLKKYYWPDVEKFKEPTDYAQSITNHKKENTFYNSSPAISPDGSKMAYISDADGLYGIYVRDIDPKKRKDEREPEKPRKLVSSFRTQDFEELNLYTPGISWSPDGKFLAVSAKAGGEDAIFIVNEKNGDYEKLKLGFCSISSVVWSPDGKYLCFNGIKTCYGDLYLYDFKTKNVTQLTNDPFFDNAPQWSIDSKQIYFISDRKDNLTPESNVKIWQIDYQATDIYSLDIESRNIQRITHDLGGNISSISVAGDGSNILFVSDKNGIGNVYSYNFATGVVRPRTNSLTGITQLSISRDGSRLAFASMNGGAIDIFMLKYPLDMTVEGDVLPLTKFRASTLAAEVIPQIADVEEPANSSESEPQQMQYGNFRVKMDKPQFVVRNPDAAADLPEAEHLANINDSNFVEHDYKVNFSLDGVMGNPGYSTYYGFAGSAAAQFSDIMGDNLIYVEANLYRDLRNSNIMLSYQYLPHIIDYSVSLFQNAAYVLRRDNYYYRFRNFGLTLTAALPFNRFNRLEFNTNLYATSMENVENTNIASESRFLVVPELHFVHDDVLYGWFAPASGSRWNFGVKASPKIGSKTESFLIVEGDFRHYFTLFDYLTFASRGTFAASIGSDNRKFNIGGTDNWFNYEYENNYIPLDSPEDFVFMQFASPLRGWNIGSLSGTRYFLTNFELRFPLFQAILAGPVPVLMQGVMGSFFFDMGGAWSGDLSNFHSSTVNEYGVKVPKDLQMSAGIGVRAYLLGLPFKLDIAWRNERVNWSKPRYLFSLGYDF